MYTLGPVILDSTTGSFNLLENNTFTIYCVIQNQIDALEPLTIRWFKMGKVFNDTDTITITTTDENDDNNRIVNSTVFFNPLIPSDNLPDYKCQAFIGNRVADKIESNAIDLNVRCESVCLSVCLGTMYNSACVCLYLHVCLFVFVYTSSDVFVCLSVYVCMYECTYVYCSVCLCM